MRTRTLLAIAIAALCAAPAAAQAPDELAAAQALADAADRLDDTEYDTPSTYDSERVLDSRRCRRELRRVPERRSSGAGALVRRQEFRHDSDRLDPILMRFRSELAAAITRDPALISGRAAWRRAAKAYMALPPGGDICADLAAWRRAGYDRATIRAARDEIRAVFAAFGRGFGRKIGAAADRMRELGVSDADARRFEGDG
jgi:Ni/Co efflux regulator RcnB